MLVMSHGHARALWVSAHCVVCGAPEWGSEGKCGGIDSVRLRRCAGRVPGQDGDAESWDLPVVLSRGVGPVSVC